MARWLEISADYRCNNRCVGCFSVGDDGPSMTTRDAAAALADGRRRGARLLWLGGGEPTLRKDLFTVVRHARQLGYERVKLQTNGMLLAYPEFIDRCVAAGITDVSFSIKGATAEMHDRLTQTPGCHDLLIRAIGEAKRRSLPLGGDVLVYASNAQQLPAIVSFYAGLGIEHFDLWLFSAVDQGTEDLSGQVPKIADVMPRIVEAMDRGPGGRPDFITSLHTPPCTVPASHHACLFHAADLEMIVANPGGHSFRLEDSPIEGGTYLESCDRCAFRPRCGGFRADYARIHGDAEFQPVGARSSDAE